MKTVALCLGILLTAAYAFGQQYTIQGTVTDQQAQPLPGVNVTLARLPDTVTITVVQTDLEGAYRLESSSDGLFLIVASFVGMKENVSSPFRLGAENTSVSLPPLVMTEEVTTLEEVAVTAERNAMEVTDGKRIYNVESKTSASGNSAFDLLQRAPGVNANQEGELLLNGYANVIVLLDGKMTNLSPQQLSTLLKSMPAETLSQIEVITTPTSQYDAAGNAGIINIISKKSKEPGYALDLTAGVGSGRYPQTTQGVVGNVMLGKFNIFGNYSYYYQENYLDRTSYRVIENTDGTTVYDRSSFDPSRQNNHGYKAGVDYAITPRQEVGLMYSGFSNRWSRTGSGPTRIIPQGGQEETVVQNQNVTTEPSVNHALIFHYTARLDSLGKQLTFDADYSTYINNSEGVLSNQLFSILGTPLQPYEELVFDQPTHIDIRSLKADAELPGRVMKVSTGLKYSYVTIDNDFTYDSLINGQYVFSPTLSNHFVYDEQIYAAYASASKQWENTSVNAGLRVERTVAEGNSINLNRLTRRVYTNLFPYLSVEKRWRNQHSLTTSLTRRINRPLYSNLNPARYFFDKFSYYEGNPLLQPEVSWNAAATYTLRNQYVLTLGYVRTDDPISGFARENTQTGELVVTTLNFSHRDDLSALLMIPLYPTDFWEIQNSVSLRYLTYTLFPDGAAFQPEQVTVDLSSVHSWRLARGHSLELSAYYTSPSLDGVYVIRPYFTVDAGYRKAFMNDQLNLRLSVTDLFRTIRYWGYSIYEDADVRYNHNGDTRRVNISLSYHLGGKLKSGKQRELEEEKRVQ